MTLPTRTEFYRDHLTPCRILPGAPKFADIGICVVCQEDFNDASYDMVAVKSCSHVFHRKCIIQWTETWSSPRDKCPSCREPMYQYTPMTAHEIQAMQEAQAIQDAESRLSELVPYAAVREAERLWFASMGVSVEALPAFDDMEEPTHFSDDDEEESTPSYSSAVPIYSDASLGEWPISPAYPSSRPAVRDEASQTNSDEPAQLAQMRGLLYNEFTIVREISNVAVVHTVHPSLPNTYLPVTYHGNSEYQIEAALPTMSTTTPIAPTAAVIVNTPRSRSTSLDEVAPMTPHRRSSTASESTNDDDLDDLFEDETTWGLSLPPIPTSSPISSPDITYVPTTQKRKRDSATTDDSASDDPDSSPLSKKAKTADEDTDNKTSGKETEATRRYRTAATAASLKPSTTNAHKFLDSMRKQRSIPTPRYVPTGAERRTEVNALAAKHVRHVAPAMLANVATNRDVGGAMTKFDWAETKREIPASQIKTPSPSPSSTSTFQKWVDEEDEHVTWLVIPASRKFINVEGSMVPVVDIVNKSIKYPEWTFMEEVKGPHWKTGVEVVKAVKVRFERLTGEQQIERIDVMVKQKKEEDRQARKDEAARRRNEKREERARKRAERVM
ncbi:hypothetical protein J4E81_001753 [Alternaria sp. BMP 2799]|nr:hypothetical protein J4E81_001753 [Alternaria sp. BMP 2799]